MMNRKIILAVAIWSRAAASVIFLLFAVDVVRVFCYNTFETCKKVKGGCFIKSSLALIRKEKTWL